MAPACRLVLWLLTSSGWAAAAPAPKPPAPLVQRVQAAPQAASVLIQGASAPPGPAGSRSCISKKTLEQARSLLSEVRHELEPRQWELLDSKLANAERAYAHLNKVANASGRVAEIARGVESVAEAGRAGGSIVGGGTLTRAGPLLSLLILLWPSETAGPEQDHGPNGLPPEQELNAKLRELSKAAQQVKSELARHDPPEGPLRQRDAEEAVKRRTGERKQAPQPRPPEVTVPFPNWKPGPGERWDGPCFLKGTEGRGASLPPKAPPDWITCIIQCGKYEVRFFILSNSGDVCTAPDLLARAQKLATSAHDMPGRGP